MWGRGSEDSGEGSEEEDEFIENPMAPATVDSSRGRARKFRRGGCRQGGDKDVGLSRWGKEEDLIWNPQTPGVRHRISLSLLISSLAFDLTHHVCRYPLCLSGPLFARHRTPLSYLTSYTQTQ